MIGKKAKAEPAEPKEAEKPPVKDDTMCVVEGCYNKRAPGQVVCEKHIRTN